MTKPNYPAPPDSAAAYVEILGVEDAVEFLLTFGGAELYMPADPKGGSEVARVIGIDKARKLAAASSALKTRVPTPRRWIAQVLKSKGLPVAKIARRLHVSDVTVRKYLSGCDGPRHDPRQIPLF